MYRIVCVNIEFFTKLKYKIINVVYGVVYAVYLTYRFCPFVEEREKIKSNTYYLYIYIVYYIKET